MGEKTITKTETKKIIAAARRHLAHVRPCCYQVSWQQGQVYWTNSYFVVRIDMYTEQLLTEAGLARVDSTGRLQRTLEEIFAEHTRDIIPLDGANIMVDVGEGVSAWFYQPGAGVSVFINAEMLEDAATIARVPVHELVLGINTDNAEYAKIMGGVYERPVSLLFGDAPVGLIMPRHQDYIQEITFTLERAAMSPERA